MKRFFIFVSLLLAVCLCAACGVGTAGQTNDHGNPDNGTVGSGTTNNGQSTIDAPYIMTASGIGASMFLDREGRVFIAGNADNRYVTWSVSGTYTQEISFPEKIRKIGMSSYCAYALSESGSLWIWGSNINGQLCQDDLTL